MRWRNKNVFTVFSLANKQPYFSKCWSGINIFHTEHTRADTRSHYLDQMLNQLCQNRRCVSNENNNGVNKGSLSVSSSTERRVWQRRPRLMKTISGELTSIRLGLGRRSFAVNTDETQHLFQEPGTVSPSSQNTPRLFSTFHRHILEE